MKKISTILMMAIVVLSSFAIVKAAKQSNLIAETWVFNGGDASDRANYSKGTGDCGDGTVTCQITDVASSSNSNQPALTYGTPGSSNAISYSLQLKSE